MQRTAPTSDESRLGYGLGALGVALFALTLPMTRLAVGDASAPQLPPAFVTAGRAAVAGGFSMLYLLAVRAPWPQRGHWLPLAISAAGTVVGFPIFVALAVRLVDATHAAVITGVLPLGTAVLGAIALRQRPSAGFWACAVAGCALVLGYAAATGGGRLSTADGLLLLAVAAGSVGYVAGARVASTMAPEHVICWVLVASLPLTLPVTLAVWPGTPARPSAWLGFGYVSLVSMWLGFFAWYRGLALGGVVRVSQVQLLQPFLTLLFAVPLLGERLDPLSVVFALAVMATVAIGRKMPAAS
jgi:drug/metabolite transporter (DMT)-like permease